MMQKLHSDACFSFTSLILSQFAACYLLTKESNKYTVYLAKHELLSGRNSPTCQAEVISKIFFTRDARDLLAKHGICSIAVLFWGFSLPFLHNIKKDVCFVLPIAWSTLIMESYMVLLTYKSHWGKCVYRFSALGCPTVAKLKAGVEGAPKSIS